LGRYLRQPKRSKLLFALLTLVGVIAMAAIWGSHLTMIETAVFTPLVPLTWRPALKHRKDETSTVGALVVVLYWVMTWLLLLK